MSTAPKNTPPVLGRRQVFAGAGAVGALAAAAAVLPGTPAAPVAQAAVTGAKPDDAGGYQLTDHVKRYYQTTRV